MSPAAQTSTRGPRRAVLAAVLLLLGILSWGVSRVESGNEHHAYTRGSAPASVNVTAGSSYQLSVRGGLDALTSAGLSAQSAPCDWRQSGGASSPLQLKAEDAGSKATNVVASFVAPVSGPITISCDGWPGIYIDNADDAGFDRSGFLLLLAMVLLTLGVGLGLSELRRATEGRGPARHLRSAVAAGEGEQVQGGVGVGVGPPDEEVGGADRGDLGG